MAASDQVSDQPKNRLRSGGRPQMESRHFCRKWRAVAPWIKMGSAGQFSSNKIRNRYLFEGAAGMSDVFVSYKAEDRRRVQCLVDALHADGFSVWWDARIGGGAPWRQTIEAELDCAKCVIVIWSKRSVGLTGAFVQDEAARAQRRHVYLPVTIDKVEPPLGFGGTQALSLTGWRGNRTDWRYKSVAAATEAIIGGNEHRPPHTSGAALVDRRMLIVSGGGAVAATAAAAGWFLLNPNGAEADNSIAVLPFANLSGDPAQGYFSDGMAEELRSALARISGLKVVGRTSSEAVRTDDARKAAKTLGVANIVTGSVRRSSTTVRVNAQVVDGHTGLERWSENYDRAPGDVIKIQTDIAENVAKALSIQLGRSAPVLALGGTQNVAANDLLLKASAIALADNSQASLESAMALATAAIALDPNYADAYAQKAGWLAFAANSYFPDVDTARRGTHAAVALGRRAIQLAPSLALGHVVLGRIFFAQLDFRGSLKEFGEAQTLRGNRPDALFKFGNALALMGREEKAWSVVRQGSLQDPLNAEGEEGLAGILYYAHRYQDALYHARKGLSLAPSRSSIHSRLADILLMMGRPDDALGEFARLAADDLQRLTGEAVIAFRKGDTNGSERFGDKLRQTYGAEGNYQYACIYAQRRQVDQAFAALDQALATRDPGLSQIRVDPYLDPIRSDPRLAVFIRKLDLPPV